MKPWNIYTSISELPFANWKRLDVNKDINALFMPSGSYDRLDYREARGNVLLLEETHDNLRAEYEKEMGGEDLKGLLSSVDDIESLNIKINRLTRNLIAFVNCPTQEFVDMFLAEGYKLPEDPKEIVSYLRNRIATLEIQLEQKKALYEKHYKSEGEVTVSHEYYAKIMGEISQMKNREIPDTITTLTFCIYCNELKTHYERMKNDGIRAVR